MNALVRTEKQTRKTNKLLFGQDPRYDVQSRKRSLRRWWNGVRIGQDSARKISSLAVPANGWSETETGTYDDM